jgi:hypothetical protein
MAAILAWWGGSAVVLAALGLLLGVAVTGQLLGLLIDSRGRYSLTHLQLSLWTIVILSLVAGVFFGRWQHNVVPLGFSIPSVVLALLGISVGSAVTVSAAKAAKDVTRPANVAAAAPGPWRPSVLQVFLVEEGAYADQVVDITKFQNFVITIVLVLAYIGLSVHTVTAAGTAGKVTALPGFSATFLVLLGISHAGYLAGKLPVPQGQPAGLTVATRQVIGWAATLSAAAATGQPATLRRGQLWQRGVNVNIWSSNTPLSHVPAGGSVVVIDPRPFILHWSASDWHGPAHDGTAVPFNGGQYAVLLSPADLAGASALQFTRRYLDQPASVAPNGGWESTPGNNHVINFQPSPAP